MILQRGFVLWFTGLSGAGKSTLSHAVADELTRRGVAYEVLDGDVVRTNLSQGLGFSKEDRDINIRRIGFVARLLARHRVVAIVAAISPYAALRDEVRQNVEADGAGFIEVFVDCEIDALVERDTKGLYAKALAGEIDHFTGVSDPYEPPSAPDIRVRTDREDVHASARHVVARLDELSLLETL